jgi:hypothetical protein
VSSAPAPAPTLVLDAPDWAALSLTSGLEMPPLLWPVGNQSLAAHWMDHAVRLGCKSIVLHCPDRPAQVRAALEGGAYWSLAIDLRPFAAPAGVACERMNRLPSQASPTTEPSTTAALLSWWSDLNQVWLRDRDTSAVTMDVNHGPGAWQGPRCVVAPDAQLTPPYWIGAGTIIGPGSRIGPEALVGPGCVVSSNVIIEQAIVLEQSFVGSNLELKRKALCGPRLIDLERGVAVELTDRFIAAAMKRGDSPAPIGDRLLALLLLPLALLMHLLCGGSKRAKVRLPGGTLLSLATGKRGPLLARRARWLRHVVSGSLHLIGPLPRLTPPAGLHPELAKVVQSTPPGVFALSDLHGVHSAGSEEEFPHALYQSAVAGAGEEVRRALARIVLKFPAA